MSTPLTTTHSTLGRCAAYMHLNALSLALLDAQDSVRHRPEWEKAWSRLGAVLFRLGRLQESLQAYEKGRLCAYFVGDVHHLQLCYSVVHFFLLSLCSFEHRPHQ